MPAVACPLLLLLPGAAGPPPVAADNTEEHSQKATRPTATPLAKHRRRALAFAALLLGSSPLSSGGSSSSSFLPTALYSPPLLLRCITHRRVPGYTHVCKLQQIVLSLLLLLLRARVALLVPAGHRLPPVIPHGCGRPAVAGVR